MDFNPLVSIIITTCKRSDFIERAINSVINQTYKNLEIIVVDDNNNDSFRLNTENILSKFITDKKITYLKHQFNQGISAARNTGIKNANGEYIAFLDDDDEFFPNKTLEQINVFKHSDEKVGLVYGAYLEINSHNGKKRIIHPKIKNNVRDKLGINHIGPPSMVMISKKAIKKIGEFDVNLNHKEDIDYYYRLSEFFEISYTQKVLTNYYIHSGGSSKNDNDRLQKMLKYIQKHSNTMKEPKNRWSELQERLGELNYSNSNIKEGLICFFIAYKFNPSKFKIIIKSVVLLLKQIFYYKNK
tara:strand:- start:13003 stop:13902 length:900 start_codon:yes stop_codon:yes gene_type:complete